MIKIVRLAALAAVATIVATPAFAVPATSKPTANVTLTKPLTLTRDRDLNFGSVAVYASDTISIDAATGVVTCGNTPGNLTCTGSPVPARYRVTGNNHSTVNVNYSTASTLTNGTDDLTFTPSGQATVSLTNSGSVGVLFNVGGEIAIDQAVSEGLYTGDIEVTVDY